MRGPALVQMLPCGATGLSPPSFASVHWCDGNEVCQLYQINKITGIRVSHILPSFAPFTHLRKIQMRAYETHGDLREACTAFHCTRARYCVFEWGERVENLRTRTLGSRIGSTRSGGRQQENENNSSLFHQLMDKMLLSGFANDTVRWQFASSGDRRLPHLASTQEKRNFLTFTRPCHK